LGRETGKILATLKEERVLTGASKQQTFKVVNISTLAAPQRRSTEAYWGRPRELNGILFSERTEEDRVPSIRKKYLDE